MMNLHTRSTHLLLAITFLTTVAVAFAAGETEQERTTWRDDPAWRQGKAEWALYDATREIYGRPRRYEAAIFTNLQHMDPATTTKAADHTRPGMIEVFKHNVSEIVPTENYDYRFLTTCFVRADNFEPYKIVASAQEDCGSTYKQFTFAGGRHGEVEAVSHCYLPGAGAKREAWRLPGLSEHFRFHDDLTFTLRRFPFDDPDSADVMMKMIPDQTDNRQTPTRWAEARIDSLGPETIDVPYGRVETHHLRVAHEPMGGVSESHYWFAADAEAMRRVLVQYQGPYGVTYKLKRLEWWAYWSEPRP